MCWTSDYHLDINTEQNYWLTNVGNLAECNAPLFTYIADLAHHGAKTVRTVYGCKGSDGTYRGKRLGIHRAV